MQSVYLKSAIVAFTIFLVSCGSKTPVDDKPKEGNLLPVVSAGEGQILAEKTEIILSGEAQDFDGTVISYKWTQIEGPKSIEVSTNKSAGGFIAPATTELVELVFQLEALDNDGGIGTDTVSIIVNPVNTPPKLTLLKEHTYKAGSLAKVEAFFSDSDGEIRGVYWSQIAGPAVALNGANTDEINFIAPTITDKRTPELFIFEVTVIDNEDGISRGKVNVYVTPPLIDDFAECDKPLPVGQVKIEAEDYTDFHDNTPGNKGNEYRNDNVDIETTADHCGGFNVGWSEPGEWLEYEVDLQAGTYIVSTRMASAYDETIDNRYSILLNDYFLQGRQVATGGWQQFQTQTFDADPITVSSGRHILRYVSADAGVNMNWIKITAIELENDLDVDGVANNLDMCPNTFRETPVDEQGCELLESN